MFRVRPESGEPIYQQLMRQIQHAVTTGVLKPGTQLPTVRELASQLVINPNTVARAYRELEREGLIESTTGRGTFVKFAPPKLVREERKKRLQPFIDHLISEALTLNFTMEELSTLIEDTLEQLESTTGKKHERKRD